MALWVCVSLCAAGQAFAVDFCELKPASTQSPYQEVFQPTCHNCYEIEVARAMGANTFKEVLNSVKNVEVDFWDTRDAVSGGVPREWYVRHSAGTLFQSGNDNNCTGNGNGTNNLGACLNDVKQWSDSHPGHDPITLFLDKKQGWSSVSSGRRPSDLDNLVESILGNKLYKPAALQGSYPTLRQAAKARTWPGTAPRSTGTTSCSSRRSSAPIPATRSPATTWGWRSTARTGSPRPSVSTARLCA